MHNVAILASSDPLPRVPLGKVLASSVTARDMYQLYGGLRVNPFSRLKLKEGDIGISNIVPVVVWFRESMRGNGWVCGV